MDNAIKYNRPDGPVRVSLNRQDRTAAISIQDIGYGVTSTEQEKVFEGLFRSEETRKRADGSGHDLAITRQAARAFPRWRINLSRNPHQGASVTLKLPLAT